jgi:hypothetical protein
MPSTYSPNLRIELITSGEQSGTWGNTTNINLGSLIEAAISGYIDVTTTVPNQALIALEGAPDQARNMVINLTTSTSNNFNVFIPPVEKFYVIRNSSIYAATIYCSTILGNTTAAGAGVTVPAQSTSLLFSDKVDVSPAITFLAGNADTANTAINATTAVNATNADNLTGSGTISSATTGTTQAENTATGAIATTAFVDRLRSLSPPTTEASGVLVIGDRGSLVQATGTITVPANVFTARDVVTVYNNSASPITIAQPGGMTLRQAGLPATGNRTLAANGLATMVFITATEAVISGGGLT